MSSPGLESDYELETDYSTDETGSASPSTSPAASEPPEASKNPLVIIDGKLRLEKDPSKKTFHCHWDGCHKSYTKPIRLEEHLRSHTNERPYSCPTCPATYRRETHLTAHMRVHLPESARPLLCGWKDPSQASGDAVESCQRRFWTQQHLKIHRENVHEGKKDQVKLKCEVCAQEFLKHRSLRSHFIQEHCPKDTPKPYICPHPSCGLSFSHPSRLRKHERTHDPFRYSCVHQDCLNDPQISIHQRSFPSWTELQRHTRDAHPFICHEPSCNRNKKPFKSIRSLKQHIQSYHHPSSRAEQDDNGTVLPVSQVDESSAAAAARNTGAFVCTDYLPCQRAYKSARALQRHVNLIHLIDRHTSCPYEGCTFSSAFPSGLTRHMKSRHSQETQAEAQVEDPSSDPDPTSDPRAPKRRKLTRVEKLTQIDLLTGIGYANQQVEGLDGTVVTAGSSASRKFACPFYDLQLTDPPLSAHPEQPLQPRLDGGPDQTAAQLRTRPEHDRCLLRFNRLYDIQRHLLSFHGLSVDRQLLRNFYGVA